MKRFFMTAAFAAVAMFVATSSAQADIVYSENADGLTAGSSTLADSADWNGSAADYGVLAGGAVFGTNHFELTVPDTNFNFGNWEGAGFGPDVTTFSIDLADTGGGGTNTDAGVRIAARRSGGSTFRDITSLSLADNTVSTFHVVANNSASTVTYEDGVTTIAAGTLDFWQDGSLVSSVGSLNGTGAIFSWGLWARRPDNAMLADNIEIRNTAFNGTAAIPEPSSIALLGLVGLAGALRRRR